MSRIAGLSSVGLGRMREVMGGYVERGELPGLVTAVERRGEVHIDPVGTLAVDDSVQMRGDTIFRIASMSKPVVAVAALILVEECVLRLDEPVDAYLPELADRRVLRRPDGPLDDTVPATRPITLLDLLTFTWGFGQMFVDPATYPALARADELGIGMGPPAPAETPEPDEWMRRLGTLPLLHQPGEGWAYNTGSDVLSVLIARAAGQPLEAFLRERIFAPLGMADTGFSVPPEKADRFATSYGTDMETGERYVFDDARTGQWNQPPAFPLGGGGLVSTVEDYLRFARMLLDNGAHEGGRILSRPSVATMTSNHLTAEQRAMAAPFLDERGWGFGVAVTTKRRSPTGTPGRYGWDGGLGTSWANDPAEELIGIVLTQSAWTSPAGPRLVHDFWTLAYAAIDD